MEIASPFPVGTKVLLTMQIAQLKVQAPGFVRVMHPEIGMGVEFIKKTPQQKESIDKFIEALMNADGVEPQFLVEPDGFDSEPAAEKAMSGVASVDADDPLIDLFHNKSNLTAEAFLHELRNQRNGPEPVPAGT